jgi:CubicO group peptidase (beta-lactamase class C family)
MASAAIVATAAASSAQPADAVVHGELGARVDSFLTRAAAHGFSGAIVVARRGEVVLRKGYGLADRERGTPVVAETPFFVGSLAKQFTAAAVLRLEADGRLSLSDSLGRFFPSAPADKRAITVRHLLSHTSGLPYLPSAGLFGRGSRDSVMQEMLAERLMFEPGTGHEYSSPGYVLLAGVIEHASGLTYEQYMRSAVFERAALRSTGFVGEHTRWSASPVRSYSDATTETSLAEISALPRFVGAGSIVTTVGDLHRWYEALTRGDVLPPAQREALFAPALRLRPPLQQALGWMLVRLPTGTLRQAAGDIGGFNAELRHYVDEGLVVAFASNVRVRGRGYREVALNTVARMSRGERVPLPPAVASLDAAEVQPFAGSYQLSNGGHVDLWLAGDTVLVGATDGAGLAALAGHDSSATRRAAEIDARADRLLKALETNTGAYDFMHASIPADARAAFLERLRAVVGVPTSGRATLVGTAVDSPANSRSYVRIRHADGEDVISLVWNGGRLVGLEPAGRAAYPLRLRPEGPRELASFDLFTGRLVRVALLGERELAIESNGVTQRAVR